MPNYSTAMGQLPGSSGRLEDDMARQNTAALGGPSAQQVQCYDASHSNCAFVLQLHSARCLCSPRFLSYLALRIQPWRSFWRVCMLAGWIDHVFLYSLEHLLDGVCQALD